MTREELRDAVTARVDEDCIHGIDAERCASDVLAIFDRYEREQWRPGGWPPNDTHSKLVIGGDGDGRWYSLAYCVLGGDGWIHTSGVPMPQRVTHWRELPPGPGEGEMTSHEQGRLRTIAAVASEAAESLRAENERLRAVVSAALSHDHIVLLGESGPCDICVALAALDQERKEGE